MGCRFQRLSCMALLVSEEAGFERPCFAVLSVEGQATLIGFKRQFKLAFILQQLSVMKPVSGTTGVFFKGLQNRFNGFCPCTSTCTQSREKGAVSRRVDTEGFESTNGVFSILVAHGGKKMGVGAQKFRVVGREFHASLKPVSVECIVTPQASDVFQSFQHACMTRRELVGRAERPFSPIVPLKVSGCQSKSMRRIPVNMQR